MAKASKTSAYPYPSRFGSHASMVVNELTEDDVEKFGVVTAGRVVCEDEFGRYITQAARLDNGLADPARYASVRLTKLYERGKDKK